MFTSLKDQLIVRKLPTLHVLVHAYLWTRSLWERFLWSFPPNGWNWMRTDSPLVPFNVQDPLKAALFKMYRTDSKYTFRCEICPVCTNKSNPLIPLGSVHRVTMQRNVKFNVWFIAAPLHYTATWRHYLVRHSKAQFSKSGKYFRPVFPYES